jgi:hypothetical protein
MTQLTLEFGFHPGHLELDSGPVMVRPLPDCEEPIKHVLASQTRAKDWIYAPAQQSRDFMSGAVSQKPYSARVFGLPRTHSLRHANAAGDDHLDFHLWGLSFFSGLRLTVTEAGFSTPHRSRLGNSSTSCRCATPSKGRWLGRKLLDEKRGRSASSTALRGGGPCALHRPEPAVLAVRTLHVSLRSARRLLRARRREALATSANSP